MGLGECVIMRVGFFGGIFKGEGVNKRGDGMVGGKRWVC